MTILYFLPLGGQKSEVPNAPTTVSIPLHGLDVPDMKFRPAWFTAPPSLHLTLPLFGSAEAHAKLSCNLYNWETSFYLGNKTVDVPTYVAELKTVGQSPVKVLSYKLEGKRADTLSVHNTMHTHLTRQSDEAHRILSWLPDV